MATVPTPTLYPLNDFSLLLPLKMVNATTGKVEKVITGTVTFFIATSNTPTAVAADGTLAGSATHVGSGNWLIQLDAAALTAVLLATLFASTPPVLIVIQPNGFRVYLPLLYAASRPAILVAS